MPLSRTFEAKIAVIDSLIEFVGDFATEQGLPPKRSLPLQLALEEAVVNICNYAYSAPNGEIEVKLEHDGNRLTVELWDEGIPFDPLATEAPDLSASLEEREIGGLGIFLIGKMMDEVRYRREGKNNVLTLIVSNNP
ncbi:MAG TPA: ATP-binding protein [Cyanobacteria bacterium UBA8530]|nr:ATP-binding protein [Cyanobacteria bacterium UBA8530]